MENISSKIDQQKKTVDSIIKNVSSIEEKFKNQNNESLKKIGTELLNQYQKRAEKAEAVTKSASDHVDEVLEKLNEYGLSFKESEE